VFSGEGDPAAGVNPFVSSVCPSSRSQWAISAAQSPTDRSPRTRDILDYNCRQQGVMQSHALVRRLMELIWAWLGFRGCGTSLLYRAPPSQSFGRPCAVE
jgi:hypothetical protein